MINRNVSDLEINAGGLLLHACCGPCAEYPLYDLKERGITPTFYYMNPNIHPQEEWVKRYEALDKLAKLHDIKLEVNRSYAETDWTPLGKAPERCQFCYTIRMNDVAKTAKEQGFSYFTTTLLVSPYQNYEILVSAGIRAAERYGVAFLKEDWRENFRKGQEMAREEGLYRQKYCGCILSLQESKFLDKIKKQHLEFKAKDGSPQPKVISFR